MLPNLDRTIPRRDALARSQEFLDTSGNQRGDTVWRAVPNAGTQPTFLLPYSPCLNRIEQRSAKQKRFYEGR